VNHVVAIWLGLLGGTVLTGAGIVSMLVAERTLTPVAGTATLLGFVGAMWGFGEITNYYAGLHAPGYAFLIGLGGLAGGYALASTLLFRLASRHRHKALPTALPPRAARPEIVVLSELEPPAYSARATASALEDLADEGLLDASIWALPFLFMAQKTRYRAAGGTSPGSAELEAIAEKLALVLRPTGVGSVLTAACEGEHSLSARIVGAVERGARTIVVAQAFVAESLEVDRAKREVDSLRLSDHGIAVTYADPLWCSALCASLVASKALAVAGEPSTCGVVLVGQAQPEERSHIAGEFDVEETGFLNQIRMLLVERGVPEPQVRIAWADWRSPEVTGSVRHLAALGCRTVIVVPACFPLDSIATMLDLPLSVRQARVDQSVNVVTLQAWHDEPGLVEALRAKVVSALDASDTESGTPSQN
jgi:sirohydrochlorin ferrochelatase